CGLGLACAMLGHYDRAIKQFEEAVKLRPDLVPAHYNLGMVYLERNQYKQAIRHLKQVLRIRPKNAKARRLLDKLYRLNSC
ncbi:MAG: tetratricopeptide repeat protein, partial [Candidatus Brocadiales bacterium]